LLSRYTADVVDIRTSVVGRMEVLIASIAPSLQAGSVTIRRLDRAGLLSSMMIFINQAVKIG
jgi:hypothetical protein